MSVKGSYLIDSNVLIYATLANDPRHAVALVVLEMRRIKGNSAYISVQNLAEMYPNLTGPKNQPPDTPEIAGKKIEAIACLDGVTVLPVTAEVVRHTLKLCEKHGVLRQNYFDWQLVALMELEGIRTLVTENVSDFMCAASIKVWNPF